MSRHHIWQEGRGLPVHVLRGGLSGDRVTAFCGARRTDNDAKDAHWSLQIAHRSNCPECIAVIESERRPRS